MRVMHMSVVVIDGLLWVDKTLKKVYDIERPTD